MQIAKTIAALRAQVKAWRQDGKSIAFVPTMGNLHQGHLSLVKKAKELADVVVVSIFVNPLQFDDKADLNAYPRTLDEDIQQLTFVACNLVFTPPAELMYPDGMEGHTHVHVPNLDNKLCGLSRLGHFDGVATVVTKLLNMVQADIAVFGEKDYQQLLLIKKMVKDLNFPVEIIAAPTFREQSGLAMSSRNQYLSEEERKQAAAIYQTLLAIKLQLEQGANNYEKLQQAAMEKLRSLGFQPDYVEIRRAADLEHPEDSDKDLRILIAARLGKARLIDNIACYLA